MIEQVKLISQKESRSDRQLFYKPTREVLKNRKLLFESQGIKNEFISQLFPPRIQEHLLSLTLRVPVLKEIQPVFLFGGVGTGKTLMVSAMFLQYYYYLYLYGRRQPKISDFKYITVTDYLDSVRSSYNNGDSIYKELCNVTYLVLDDIGVEKVTDWSYEQVLKLINYRYEYLKRTWFTSNLSLPKLAEKHSDKRITRRIESMAASTNSM